MSSQILTESTTLSPLPEELSKGLIPVAILGFISFVSVVSLFTVLLYQLVRFRRTSDTIHYQFLLLIFNLLLADIQQSIAFLLNAQWLAKDEITVGSSTCWAQGFFVSTGDLASGVWCVAIGLHTFASVIVNYKLGKKSFTSALVALWAFVYAMVIIQVGVVGKETYVRAGAWCWIDQTYSDLRLWTHYFFIFIAEFGTVVIYAVMYILLNRRIRSNYFPNRATANRAKHAANLMIFYPLVYVICTLPLASARMSTFAGHQPTLAHLCIAGAMITSNGWLDVVVYTFTRRVIVLNSGPVREPVDTFGTLWTTKGSRFGTSTTIEGGHQRARPSHGSVRIPSRSVSRQGSTDELFGHGYGPNVGVKTTTVKVHSEPLELADVMEMNQKKCPREDGKSIDEGVATGQS